MIMHSVLKAKQILRLTGSYEVESAFAGPAIIWRQMTIENSAIVRSESHHCGGVCLLG